MSSSKIKVITLLIAILIAIPLIYLGWKKPSKEIDFNTLKTKQNNNQVEQLEEQYKAFVKNIGNSTQAVSPNIIESTDTNKLNLNIQLLDSLQEYAYAGVLTEKKANITGLATDYAKSARYLLTEAYNNSQPMQEMMFAKKAQTLFQKSLEINPNNNTVKIDYAVCTKNLNDILPPKNQEDIMRPMLLLLEVNRADSTNEEAIFYLGKLVYLQPRKKMYYQELIEVYKLLGDEKQVQKWSERANKIN